MSNTTVDILTNLMAEGTADKEHQVKVSRDFWDEPADEDEFTILDNRLVPQ